MFDRKEIDRVVENRCSLTFVDKYYKRNMIDDRNHFHIEDIFHLKERI